jgi:hypothetical protein
LPQPLRKDQRITIHELAAKGGWVTLKTLRRKNKTQFKNGEHNTQNAIALLNYLKRIAPQQLMLRTQVFAIFLKRKEVKHNFLNEKT